MFLLNTERSWGQAQRRSTPRGSTVSGARWTTHVRRRTDKCATGDTSYPQSEWSAVLAVPEHFDTAVCVSECGKHGQTVHVLKEVWIGEASGLITTALVFFFTVSLLLLSCGMQLLKTQSAFAHLRINSAFPLFVWLSAFTLSICILCSSL